MTESTKVRKKTGHKIHPSNVRRLRRLLAWIRAQPRPVSKQEMRRNVRLANVADPHDKMTRLVEALKENGDIFSPERGLYQASRTT